jgi:hypothetical protein
VVIETINTAVTTATATAAAAAAAIALYDTAQM